MKLSLTLAGLVGLATASPFTEHDTSNGLLHEARGGKCNWHDKHCCAYPDRYKTTPYEPEHKNYYGYGRTIYVKPNMKFKIQDAIKKASPGDRIVVAAGTYNEQLVINKDGIHLEGHGAILAPTTYKRNACTGLVQDPQKKELDAGICITGHKVKTTEFIVEHKRVISVERPVKGVSVSGFTVQGSSGINIAIQGAKNTRISGNTLIDAGAYGALTLGSVNTVFYDNKVTTTKGGYIGICQDNKSDVFTIKNDVSAYLIGLCVQTNSAVIERNTLYSNCIGIFVDPGVKGVKISHNTIGPSAPACGNTGAGIIIGSGIGTLVSDNTITGQRAADKSGAGIRIYDDKCVATPEMPISLSCITLGRAVKARDNIVIRNKLSDNDNDISNLSQGTGNVIKCNTCTNEANIKAGQCTKP
ncbi:pectin lyase fold/virulence factor [Fusarium acuminatum]|uniref:Pectin lyase fold/virulence factor n=1 Tax=Fusarium acuminatum TaxID=5515 RepID=A0ABZ2X063_9HYPO